MYLGRSIWPGRTFGLRESGMTILCGLPQSRLGAAVGAHIRLRRHIFTAQHILQGRVQNTFAISPCTITSH